jgi:hypothetical protein
MTTFRGVIEKHAGRRGGFWHDVTKGAGALLGLGFKAAQHLGRHPELFGSLKAKRTTPTTPLPKVVATSALAWEHRKPLWAPEVKLPAIAPLGHIREKTYNPVWHGVGRKVPVEAKVKFNIPKAPAVYGDQHWGQRTNAATFMGHYDPWEMRKDWGYGEKDHWPRLHAGKHLTDRHLKQLWHDIDLVRYGVNDRMARMKAEALQQYAEQQLAQQMVRQAPKNDQGEVIIWGTPVRAQDALGHALQDVRYFREHDRHLGPGQVVASKLDPGPTRQKAKAPVIMNVGKDELYMPAGFNLQKNVLEASKHPPTDLEWFYKQVHNKGNWDYKQQGPLFENFGNFHYGVVGAAQGIPDAVLLRAAGAAQYVAGTANPDWGSPIYKSPYGDDPLDQYWIKKGISYYKNVLSK